eukprot:15550-Heterococcus_DN1.PRE.11
MQYEQMIELVHKTSTNVRSKQQHAANRCTNMLLQLLLGYRTVALHAPTAAAAAAAAGAGCDAC